MCTREEQAAAIWCGRLHTTRALDRIAPPARPRRDKSDAMLGKWVETPSARLNAWHGGAFSARGQVWCAAATGTYGRGCYWIATDGGFVVAYEGTFVIARERSEDVPMLEVAS